LVDGSREPPTHSQFAEYLCWVAQTSGANVIYGDVGRGGIGRDGADWLVRYRPRASRTRLETLRVGGVVVTGPGKPIHLLDGQDDHFTISTGETFWSPTIINDFRHLDRRLDGGEIAVVGSGDTAASIVVALLDGLPSRAQMGIEKFCRTGMLSPRIEDAGDLKWWSDPRGWSEVPEAGRRNYIWRTERGVCSRIFYSRIKDAPNVTIRPGMVRAARMNGKKVSIEVEDETGNCTSATYRRLVIAIGFRRWDFQTLFQDQTIFPPIDKDKPQWEQEKEWQMSQRIRPDLSYDCRWSGTPKLYVPTLAGLNHGPGFPNLGCLGTLSERIIESYLAISR